MRRFSLIVSALFALLAICPEKTLAADAPTIVIGSKADTEGQILAEILARLIEARTPYAVVRHPNLGGTLLLFEALRSGAVDTYPEYTGTIDQAILHASPRFATLRTTMRRRYGLFVSDQLGFNNTYVLAMKTETARRLGVRRISDLAAHRDLRWGVTPEFLKRDDGLPGLERRYDLGAVDASNVEKILAYQAIAQGRIQVTDAYSTDGELLRYHLTALEDDRHFFPEYRALFLVRESTLRRAPRLRAVLGLLSNAIDDPTMTKMNARVDLERVSPEEVAADFIARRFGGQRARPSDATNTRLLRAFVRHVVLTFSAVLIAMIIGIPLSNT